jgi:hypothetical protein
VVGEPQVADAVDLFDLRGGEQAAQDQAAIDDRGALVALRRDGVDAADPRRLVRVDAQRALAQLGGGQAEDGRVAEARAVVGRGRRGCGARGWRCAQRRRRWWRRWRSRGRRPGCSAPPPPKNRLTLSQNPMSVSCPPSKEIRSLDFVRRTATDHCPAVPAAPKTLVVVSVRSAITA